MSPSLGKRFPSLGKGIPIPREKGSQKGFISIGKVSTQNRANSAIHMQHCNILLKKLFVVGDSLSLSSFIVGCQPPALAAGSPPPHSSSPCASVLPCKSGYPRWHREKKARLQPTFTIFALKSRCQVSKLLRALDSQELADVTGTGLALGSFKNKLSETLNESYHAQTPYAVEMRHYQL